MIRELWWMIVDAFNRREQDLYIDLRRVNQEDCRVRRLGLDEDVHYREKVKERMVKGLTSQQLKPLYDVPRKPRRNNRKNVYTIPLKKEA